MNAPTIRILVLPFLVGILGAAQPSAEEEPVVGGSSNAPATNIVVDMVKSPLVIKGLFRNPRSLTNAVSSALLPDTAVMRSLRWLRETQNADGSWSTDRDPKAVGTALAVLAFLSHGETPASEEFGDSVRMALKYLISVQQENGAFTESGKRPAIAHGIITWALCEAYGMTRIPMLGQAAEKALQVILVAQRSSGLWDTQYRTNDGEADCEVSAWQVRAVYAGRWMGSKMPGLAESLKAAADGVAAVAPTPDASSAPFAIQPLQLLHRKGETAYAAALDALKGTQINWAEPQVDDPIVRWHLTAQALFWHGGGVWSAWNRASVPNLVNAQTMEKTAKGIEIGYWDSPGKGEKYGRVYSTALCSLMLWSGSMRPSFVPYVPAEQPEQDDDDEDIRIEIR